MNIWRVNTYYSPNDDKYEVARIYFFQSVNCPTMPEIQAWFDKNGENWPDFDIVDIPIRVNLL